MDKHKIEKGKLLLAEPFMDESVFQRCAIFLCELHKDGALGFIINKQLDFIITDLIKDFPEFNAAVFYGGPVQTDTIHYIHTKGDLLEDSIEVQKGIFWGGDFNRLKFLITNELIKPADIRFYLGYSGWTEGQLQEEVKSGSWMISESDPNYIFTRKWGGLWKRILNDAGGTKAVIANMDGIDFQLN